MRGIHQGRLFPISMLEREQPSLAAHSMQIESSWTPPAEDSTCERGSGQGRVGSKASGTCRVPKLPAARPGAGSQVRAGPKNKLRRTLRSASQDARDRVRPQPRSTYRAAPHCGGRPSEQPTEPVSCASMDYPANKKKGQEPLPVPALSEVSKLVEHAAVDRVDHPRCEMCWQDVVVTLVEGKVPEFVILDNVLIEEAVQRSLLGCLQSLEIAP